MPRTVSVLLLLFLGMSVFLPAPALQAQIPQGVEGSYEPHPEALKAIDRLLSPYCPGFMLEVCPSSEAQRLRDDIHARAMTGANANELVEWMVGEYGEQYRAVPKRTGAGFWAWILPPLALILGSFGVWMALRRFGPRPEPALAGAPAASEEAGSSRLKDGKGSLDPALDPETQARLKAALRDIELSEDPL
jgi:cytochrome c-type biogenesis protein CcmH/NrfF